ncbi:MAG: NifU family protein [Parachlamydiales bacterium]|nr:NifU family protein [Parachlamydiales bacterium]
MKFSDLSKQEQQERIEEVLEREIRPFLMADGGNLELVDIRGKEVVISYRGACAHCPGATGATLSAIQSILKEHVDEDIIVVPEF